jgi:hypothetical protein
LFTLMSIPFVVLMMLALMMLGLIVVMAVWMNNVGRKRVEGLLSWIMIIVAAMFASYFAWIWLNKIIDFWQWLEGPMEWLWVATVTGIPFVWLVVGVLVWMAGLWMMVNWGNEELARAGLWLTAAALGGVMVYNVKSALSGLANPWQGAQTVEISGIGDFTRAFGWCIPAGVVGFALFGWIVDLSEKKGKQKEAKRQVAVRPTSQGIANAMETQQQLEQTFVQALDGQDKMGEVVRQGMVVHAQIAEAIEAVRRDPGRSPEVQQYVDALAIEMQKKASQAVLGVTQEFEKQVKNKISRQ